MLKLGNHGIELLSIFHISSGIDNRLLRRAHRAGCDIDSTSIEPFHGNGEPLTFFAQSIGRRDANIIKADLPRGLRIPTHLALFLTVGNSLEISGYEKRGDAPGSAIACSRHDNEDIRVASARDENLAAIEPIAIALSHGSGPQRRRI